MGHSEDTFGNENKKREGYLRVSSLKYEISISESGHFYKLRHRHHSGGHAASVEARHSSCEEEVVHMSWFIP
jgi:hypothetical protein